MVISVSWVTVYGRRSWSAYYYSVSSPWYNRTGWLGVKHQLTYLLFSVGSVQSSIQLSAGFSVVQSQFSVRGVQGVTVQWVILRLYSSGSAVFRALVVHQESVMFMSCSESTLWRSSAPAQFLNFNIPSTTEGHLRTKCNVKLFLNPLINAQ